MKEADVRKKFGLPKKKAIRYYDRKVNGFVNVVKVTVEDEYPTWSILKCRLETGEVVHIHSSYLKEMQKPSFKKNKGDCEKEWIWMNDLKTERWFE